jgi:hypothetical protein
MKLRWTSHFARAYGKAPGDIQTAFDKQALFLLQTLRHPSLRAKKYDEGKDRLVGAGDEGLAILLSHPR